MEAAANARLAESQQAYDDVIKEKAALERELQQAEIELLALQGAADPRREGRAAGLD